MPGALIGKKITRPGPARNTIVIFDAHARPEPRAPGRAIGPTT